MPIDSKNKSKSKSKAKKKSKDKPDKQLLHFVFGGELEKLQGMEFRDLKKLDMVGIYPNYKSAHNAWKSKAQRTVDNAHMRYFIVHMHRLLDPDAEDDCN